MLFDDRPLRAGEKFGDADLLGLPIRLTISKRTGDQIEFKLLKEAKPEKVSLEDALVRIKGICGLK